MLPITAIPLAKLVPSEANVRRTGRNNGLDELAASIAAHGLLQNLTVRKLEGGKQERFAVIAGGRRLAALKLLAKGKRLAKNAAIPCHVLEGEADTEISLAENILHCPMHPADQYEAFAALARGHGMAAEDIAARFGITQAVVRQRLRLGAVSPKLMAAYRDDEMTLELLSAFAITDDHAAQEQVWAELPPFQRSRAAILQRLHPQEVPVSDRRARFVGLEAYEAAGGTVIRDLFDAEGGFLADAALLDRMVTEKLQRAVDQVAAEGWRWVEVMPEFDYQAVARLRRVQPLEVELTEAEEAAAERLAAEINALPEEGEAAEAEYDRLNAALAAITDREVFRPEDIARAGAILSLGRNGEVRVERGYLRPRDGGAQKDEADEGADDGLDAGNAMPVRSAAEGPTPLSAALVADLTAHRTAGLRNDLAQAPELALIAVVHALAASAFYGGHRSLSCLDIVARHSSLASLSPGLADSPAEQAMAERHEAWAKRMPEQAEDLWVFVPALTMDELLALLAHCAALTLDVVRRPGAPVPAEGHASALARAMPHDMARYWQPTVASYLGRVGKERILDAVSEAVSPEAARNMAHMKKAAMAAAAGQRLAGRGWLPGLLRIPEAESPSA